MNSILKSLCGSSLIALVGTVALAKSLWKKQVAWIIVGLLALYQVFPLVAPEPPVLTARQAELIEGVSAEAADWLNESSALAHEAAFFGNLENDRFGKISYPVRSALLTTGRLDFFSRSFIERAREWIGWDLPTYTSRSELIEAGRDAGRPYVVGGRVLKFQDVGGEAELTIVLQLLEVASGATLAETTISRKRSSLFEQALAEANQTTGVRSLTLPVRIAIWVLASALLPLVLFPFRRWLLAKAENHWLLAILIGLVLLNVGIGWVFLAQTLPEIWATVVFLALFALALLYNYHALIFLRDRV